jgi:hypothetical protein
MPGEKKKKYKGYNWRTTLFFSLFDPILVAPELILLGICSCFSRVTHLKAAVASSSHFLSLYRQL